MFHLVDQGLHAGFATVQKYCGLGLDLTRSRQVWAKIWTDSEYRNLKNGKEEAELLTD